MSNRFLIHCADGKNNDEDATVTFILAAAAAATSDQTVVFLSSDAVRIATHSYAEEIQADGYEAFRGYLEAFLENDGELWVCPVCVNARGIGTDELIDGAEIKGAAALINYVAEGGKLLK
jgi:predicted peroxiredoxin